MPTPASPFAPGLRHGEFTIERVFKAPVRRVFTAWAQPDVKAQWFKGPDEWTLLQRDLEFRVGGREILHGRWGNGVETLFTATYHAIEQDVGMVYTYDMHHAGVHLSVSLASVTFAAQGAATRMVFTEQAVYFGGEDGTASRRVGTDAHFDRLAALL